MKASIKNWSQFQHYKDRSPPWIRLKRSLLDDFDFQRLPLASKALAPMLWLLASECDDVKAGEFDADPEYLAFRLRWPLDDVKAGLKPLIEKGFVVLASEPLAPCYRDATPETETEAETETDSVPTGRVVSLRESDATDLADAVDAYNETAEQVGWPKCQRLTDARRKALRKRLADVGGVEGWRHAVAKARASPFLTGKNDKGWKADFDFLLQAKSFTRLMEGFYDDRAPAEYDIRADLGFG